MRAGEIRNVTVYQQANKKPRKPIGTAKVTQNEDGSLNISMNVTAYNPETIRIFLNRVLLGDLQDIFSKGRTMNDDLRRQIEEQEERRRQAMIDSMAQHEQWKREEEEAKKKAEEQEGE